MPLSGAGSVGVKVGGGGSDRHALKSFWDLHYLARTTYVCACVRSLQLLSYGFLR